MVACKVGSKVAALAKADSLRQHVNDPRAAGIRSYNPIYLGGWIVRQLAHLCAAATMHRAGPRRRRRVESWPPNASVSTRNRDPASRRRSSLPISAISSFPRSKRRPSRRNRGWGHQTICLKSYAKRTERECSRRTKYSLKICNISKYISLDLGYSNSSLSLTDPYCRRSKLALFGFWRTLRLRLRRCKICN